MISKPKSRRFRGSPLAHASGVGGADSLNIPYGTRVTLGELPPKGWPGEPSSCERRPVRAVFGRSFDQLIYSNLAPELSSCHLAA